MIARKDIPLYLTYLVGLIIGVSVFLYIANGYQF